MQFHLQLKILVFGPNLPKKGISTRKQKRQQDHWILHIPVSLGIKFHLKLTILIFWTKLPKNSISDQKQEQWTSRLNSACSNECRYQISAETDNFDFLDQICPKRVFPIETRKSGYHHWTLHIRINVGTKFLLTLVILSFWSKLSQTGYFQSKTKKWTASLHSEYSN